MRTGLWTDIRWGLRETWGLGIYLYGFGLVLYAIQGFPGLVEDTLPSLGGLAAVAAYITVVGATVGACRRLLRRGKAGAAAAGSICGFVVMSLLSAGMAVFGADVALGGYMFMLGGGAAIGAIGGVAYFEGRAAADRR